MRLALLLLIAFSLLQGYGVNAQTISLAVKNTSIKKVFDLIEEQAGVSFFYRSESLAKAHKVSVNISNVSLNKVLEVCFQNQPLTYEIIDKIIVVREKPKGASQSTPLPLQVIPSSPVKVYGKIVTEQGEPVEMATVTIKGTKTATQSNSDGEFFLKVDDKDAILLVTSVAIEPVEISVRDKTNLTIVATAVMTALDPVQIIGYGQTTKRFNTGNVITIKAEEIEKQPVTNILAALEGRVPGMVVIQNTGLPGGSYHVNIRGVSSLQANSDPLFIVDGVPYPAGTFALNNDYKQGGNGLNLFNIADIERVDVLKDADATAIYGSRGGNGVVLITSKKGKPGETVVNLNTYAGAGKVTRAVQMLNLQQYLEMRREALKNDNASASALDNSINGVWDTTRSTDWQKELLGGTAKITDVQLSVSGGTPSVNYLINGAYHRETTVMPVEGSARHYSLHFHLANTPLKKKIKVELSGSYQSGTDDLPPIDFTGWMRMLIPHQPSFLPDGSLSSDPWMFLNPYTRLKELYEMNSSNLVSNLRVSWTPMKGLELSSSLAYNNLSIKDFYGVPISALIPGVSSRADYGTSNSSTSIAESQAYYQIDLKRKGKLSALIGSTYQKTTSTFQNLHAYNFSNDALLANPAAASNSLIDNYSSSNYKYLGTFSRLSYNLRNKYLLNLTGRVDGTSRFGPGKQFRPFGALGAAWIFSDEKMLKEIEWLHLGKVRGSFGFIGNSNIADYAFLATYFPTLDYGNYQGIVPVRPNRLYNPDLGWELRKSLEAGLELELFKGRFGIAISAYRNRNSQQLLNTTISTTTGFTSVLENSSAAVENKGLELVLVGRPLNTDAFHWNINANISFQRNKLLRYEGPDNTSYNLVVGEPITSKKVYNFGGVDQQKGSYFFIDKNGNHTISPTNQDKTVVINTDPKGFGSITNSFSYKGLLLDISCMFMLREGKNVLGQWGGLSAPGQRINQPIEITSRWRNPGDVTNVAKYTTNVSALAQQQYLVNSSAVFGSASYLRVRNIALSYMVNNGLLKRMHLKNLRFYLKGQNLFTFSRYKNLDPENLDYNDYSMPPLRVLSAGFHMTL